MAITAERAIEILRVGIETATDRARNFAILNMLTGNWAEEQASVLELIDALTLACEVLSPSGKSPERKALDDSYAEQLTAEKPAREHDADLNAAYTRAIQLLREPA